jgi:hypothetical protein
MSRDNDMDLTPEQKRLQSSLRELGEVRADEAFRAKLREQFVTGAIAGSTAESTAESTIESPPADAPAEPLRVVPSPVKSRRWGTWSLVAAPAIAAVLVFLVLGHGDAEWELQDVRGSGAITINGESVDTSDRDALARLIVPEARIAIDEGAELDVVLGNVLVTGVVGPSEFTLPTEQSQEPHLYAFTVLKGEFRIKTGPDFPGREVLLLTTEGRVEITGTSVAVYKDAEVTCVCVLEGTAMIGKDSAHLDAVAAGSRKVMFADGSDPMIIPIEPGHEQSLIEFESFNADTFEE